MDNIIRLTIGVNKVNVGNPEDCYLEIKDLFDNIDYTTSDIIVLPKLALCSPSAGGLFNHSTISNQCKDVLAKLLDLTKNHKGYLIVGLSIMDLSRPVSALAAINNGEIIALIPTNNNPNPFINSGFSSDFTPQNSVFSVGDLRFKLHVDSIETLVSGANAASNLGCDLYVVPIYEPVVAGSIDRIRKLTASLSESLGMGIVIVNGGVADTSHPYLYHGFFSAYEGDKELAFQSSFSSSISETFDYDLDILRFYRPKSENLAITPCFHHIDPIKKQNLLKKLNKNPFLPEDNLDKFDYLEELFVYQTQSLVARMSNTGIDKLVLGVSGGIDSTAALLVSIAACDYLGLPRENILGITLPGLGTSELTYYNALALLEGLETSRRDISIRPSVLQHFTDISHSGEQDTAYENAQARERTQVLLDIANMVGGLVVGPSDLSEEALGFSTFGGDHLASFNVNACMTKTMLRELLAYFISSNKYPNINDILKEILETPISPELLPPTETGEISQKTEDILGLYPLHEFFLYYFIGYKMNPSKIYQYACLAFKDKMSSTLIKEKLELFIRKFCANQFKRSCAPDASSITNINLLGISFSMPSDIDPTALLNELNNNL